jgi:hypothetical protein
LKGKETKYKHQLCPPAIENTYQLKLFRESNGYQQQRKKNQKEYGEDGEAVGGMDES